MTYLDFEKEIEELDKNLDTLKNPYQNEGISSINKDKIDSLQSEIDKKIENLYSNLNSWQKTRWLDTKIDQDLTIILKKFLQNLK